MELRRALAVLIELFLPVALIEFLAVRLLFLALAVTILLALDALSAAVLLDCNLGRLKLLGL